MFKKLEIDFDVFKALMALRETESVTYNDVLRKLLGIDKNESLVKKNGPGT